MGKGASIQGKIVKEYLEKWGNLRSLTLAKKVYKEVPTAFKDVEAVRRVIRYYRGAQGKLSRSRIADTRFIDYNPFRLPESFDDEYFPYQIKDVKSILCLSDIHIPYHDKNAVTIALEYGKKKGVDCILLNGDIADFYQCSYFMKDPRKRKIFEELEDLRDFLTMLKKEFPKAKIIFKNGNHEERYEKYLMTKAPELLNIPDFELKNILKFDELGIEYQSCEKQIFQYNSLNIVHGHEFGRQMFSPVNPARGLFLKAKTSTVCGHHHQTSEHTEPNLNDEIVTCWSAGCLSELHPLYYRINRWNLGFMHIEGDNENFQVRNMRIYDNKIL